jgi:hypothetical protein
MRKLIVEAPELKEGQIDSSGGIRENGRISVQYKNPVPYVEPKMPPAVSQKVYTQKDMLKDQAKNFALNVGTDIVTILWYEYGRPFLQAKLHQLGLRAITYLESPSKTSQMITNQETKVPSIIDANNVEIQEADNFEENEKIICFPPKRVS